MAICYALTWEQNGAHALKERVLSFLSDDDRAAYIERFTTSTVIVEPVTIHDQERLKLNGLDYVGALVLFNPVKQTFEEI